MFNKKSTAGFMLVFSFLFLCHTESYAQKSPGRDTTYTFISQSYCCAGSVPDTSYIAQVISDNTNRQRPTINFYRFYCKICCFILPATKQGLPAKDRVTNPALLKKLHAALKKQLEHDLKVVNSVKY